MWRDIALANRQNLSRALTAFMTDLHKFQLALKNQDTAAIARFFEQAKQRRDEWARNARSHSPE
jgi:prephenate dehydrogenase